MEKFLLEYYSWNMISWKELWAAGRKQGWQLREHVLSSIFKEAGIMRRNTGSSILMYGVIAGPGFFLNIWKTILFYVSVIIIWFYTATSRTGNEIVHCQISYSQTTVTLIMVL